MRLPILLLALLLPSASLASPESDRLAALEARLARAEAALVMAQQPAPVQRASRLSVSAMRLPMAVLGLPVFGGVRITGGSFTGGTVANATTFSDDVTFNGGVGALGFGAGETLVPADGTLDITGEANISSWLNVDLIRTRAAGNTMTYRGLNVSTPHRFQDSSGNTLVEIIDGGSNGGLRMPIAQITIADNGGGTAAAHTALPTGGLVEVTCSDANGCTWLITETSAQDGQYHTICNISANTLTMTHSAGQQLLTGAADVALGAQDCMAVTYSSTSSAWRQVGATANN